MSEEKFNIGVNLDDSNKIELTKEGKKGLEEKLRNLIDVERPNVQRELAESRAQGDLSENAEYDAAKNKQAEIEAEIARIEDMLVRAKIVKTVKNAKVVSLGSIITYRKKGTKSEKIIKIVPDAEYNPFSEIPKIGVDSIFVKSILGRKINEDVLINNIDNSYEIEIIKIA